MELVIFNKPVEIVQHGLTAVLTNCICYSAKQSEVLGVNMTTLRFSKEDGTDDYDTVLTKDINYIENYD